MIEWFAAMAIILPFMRGPRRLRAWMILVSSAVAAQSLPYALAYLPIDILSGFLVLKRPLSNPQRLIGMIFAGMAIFDLGFIVGGQNTPVLYAHWLQLLGWAQAAILFAWGVYDTNDKFNRAGGSGGHLPAHHNGA